MPRLKGQIDVERLVGEVTEQVIAALRAPSSGGAPSNGRHGATSGAGSSSISPTPSGGGAITRATHPAPSLGGARAHPGDPAPGPREASAARRRPRRLIFLLPVPTPGLPGLLDVLGSLSMEGWGVRVLSGEDVAGEAAALGPARGITDLDSLSSASVSELLRGLSAGDAIILGSLGFGLASRLTRLEDDDPFVGLVVSARLRGLPVLVLRDDLDAAAGVEGEIARRASGLLREIEGLGLEVLPAARLEDRLERASAGRSVAERSAGGLVTEAEVERLHESGERRLVLSPCTLVTPLARSRAAEMGLELVEKGAD